MHRSRIFTSPAPEPHAHTGRLLPAVLLGLLALVMLVPPGIALFYLDRIDQLPALLIATAGILLLLGLLRRVLPAPLAWLVASIILAAMAFTRLFFYGVVVFSGAGFSSEIFVHLELRSLIVALTQNRGLFLALGGLLVGLPLAWALILRRLPRATARQTAVLALLALGVVVLARGALPEWMLAKVAHAWYRTPALSLSDTELQRWRASGLVTVDLPPKQTISAIAPAKPTNLILIYLESVGRHLIEHPDYPDLMPRLAARLTHHDFLRDYFTASYITIEGITNSQCGTLFPFDRDSRTMAGSDGLAEDMACLGDILARAGYVQHYLGGASTSFAGKGSFLAAHGYDTIMGMEEWQALGLTSGPGGWGLRDSDLFQQALEEAGRLRATGQPFNLSLLTLGTHLPGFVYEPCTPYGSGEEFIDALNCTDQLLDDFLSRLEQDGYFEDSLVVVTADHHVFPNPEMRRLFGDAAVEDRRLPLLVIGAGAGREPQVSSGASYDLAPTLLDLLGIQHDARFALGRSLLQEGNERDWFPTRYRDVYQGQYFDASETRCREEDEPLEPPLPSCDKNILKALLQQQNTALSMSLDVQIDCHSAEHTHVTIPASAQGPIRFVLHGTDIAPRFTTGARSAPTDQPGLFAAVFTPDGLLIERNFISENIALRSPNPPVPEGHAAILAWRANSSSAPAWMVSSVDQENAVAILDTTGKLRPLTASHGAQETRYRLDAESCAWLLP